MTDKAKRAIKFLNSISEPTTMTPASPPEQPTDAVERVARAICEARGFDPDKCLRGYSWEAGEMGRTEAGSVCHYRAWQEHDDAARAAIAALPTPQTDIAMWRPIESAPKDERPRLLYWPACADHPEHFGIREDNGGPFRHPTHWMPLPAPPPIKEPRR